jgi:hypothetical protein
MSITYTNRKGVTYYLHRSRTKSGKPRYYFSRKDQGKLMTKIPEGFEIRESPNGVVSLARKKPMRITDSEVQTVQDAIDRHPKDVDCRMDVKPKLITVYERVGPTTNTLIEIFSELGFQAEQNAAKEVSKILDQNARYEPVLRFELKDDKARIFSAERMTYTGQGGWLYLESDSLEKLVKHLIPLLDTDEFFELY